MHGLPSELGRQSGSLVEREQELATLLAALGDAAAGRGSFALVTGELGIGKSRLCSELVVEATRRGFATLQATADPLSADVALAPITSAVARHVSELSGAPKAHLLRTVDVIDELISTTLSGTRNALRATPLLFRQLDSLLDTLTSSNPMLLLIDDAEFLDELSCLALRHLGDRLPRLPLMVVLSGRPPSGSRTVVELADHMQGAGRTVSLPRLTDAGVKAMLSSDAGPDTCPNPAAPDVARLQRIAGLPLYARAIVDEPSTDPEGDGPPSLVAARVERELRRLTSDERRLFDILMVAGGPIPFDALTAAGVGNTERAAAALRRLLDRQLVTTNTGAGEGRFSPAHPMYTEWAAAALFDHERRHLHAAIGRALDECTGRPEDAAQHFIEAGATASGSRFVPVLREAARAAEARRAHEDVVRYLQPLVELPSTSPSELAARLEDLGEAQERAGAVVEADESWRRGIQVAVSCGDATRAESISYRRATTRVQIASVPDTVTTVAAVQERADPDDDGAVRDLRTLVWSARFGDARQLRGAAVRLLQAPQRNDSAAARCSSELGRGMLSLLDGDIDDAYRRAEYASTLARQTSQTFLIDSATRLMSRILVLTGDLAGAMALVEGQLLRVNSAGQNEATSRVWMGLLRYFSGDLAGATENASLASSAAAVSGAGRAAASASTLSALIAAERGLATRMRAELANAQRMYRDGMRLDKGLASFAEAARSALALQVSAPSRVADPSPDTFDMNPPLLCLRPLFAGLAGVAMNQPERASHQADSLRALGRASPVCGALALRLDGLAEIASGRRQEGAELLREASQQLGSLGIRLQAAQTVVEWGEAGAQGRSDDLNELIRGALATFQEQGVRFWADRARRVARSRGLSASRSHSSSALTSRELEVAGLVAGGLSNAAIARRLFLSERTVETHMRHIYAALGLRTRVEVARWLDLDGDPLENT